MKRYIKSSKDENLDYKYKVDGGPQGDYIGDYDEDLAKYYSQKSFKTVRTNDPKEAIEAWFKAEDRFPSDAAIFAYNAEDEMALCRWVIDNEDTFRNMYLAHRCPYKYEWLIECANEHKDKASGIYMYDFPDQISPFCYG